MKVLLSAFACEPDEGSEPEVGWKWAQVMSELCDVTVVTQAKNRPRIERWHEDHPEQDKGIRYSYLELGSAMRWLKKNMPGGMYVYYALWQWLLRSHITKLLGEEHFDLIHHVTFASFRMPVWVRGLPVVWGPVGGAETAPMHLLAGYGTFAGRLRERIRNINTFASGKLLWLLEPTRRSNGIALASTPATARLLERNGIPCTVMPTIGHDGNESGESRFRRQPNTPLRLLFVGRLHLLKGIHLLLEALSRVQPSLATLTIVGDGNERERLIRLAMNLGVRQRVTFCGYLPRTSLPQVFEQHDVLVAPSLYESGGLSVLEGFSKGLPAIVLDCGGHALSVDETCGVRVPTSLPQAEVVRELASAITAYADDRELLRRHGSAGKARLVTAYSWHSKHDAMLAVYRRTICLQATANRERQ